MGSIVYQCNWNLAEIVVGFFPNLTKQEEFGLDAWAPASICICLLVVWCPRALSLLLCLAAKLLAGSVLPHFHSLCLHIFLAWVPTYTSWYNFHLWTHHLNFCTSLPFLFSLLPTYDCSNFEQNLRWFLVCISFHCLLIIVDYKKNDFLCHLLWKHMQLLLVLPVLAPFAVLSSGFPVFIYDCLLCAAVTTHPRPFKGSACVCTSVGTIRI